MTNETQSIKIPSFLRISKIIAYILYIWVLIGVITLTLRVFLLAFSANPATPFVNFIYKTSADYLNPFRGIFPSKPVGETGYFDVAAMFAIIIYLFIMWGFSSLVSYIQYKIDLSRKEQEKQIYLASNRNYARVNQSSSQSQASRAKRV